MIFEVDLYVHELYIYIYMNYKPMAREYLYPKNMHGIRVGMRNMDLCTVYRTEAINNA